MWKDFVNKGVKVLSEAAEVAVHLKTNPGAIGLIAVGARVVNAINEVTTQDPSKFFSHWRFVRGVYPLGDFILALCKSAQLLVEENSSSLGAKPAGGAKILTANLGGVRIGWVEHDNWNDGPFVAPDSTPERAVDAMRELIWAMMGNAVKFYSPPIGSPVLLGDSIDETLPSKTADGIWDKQRAFTKLGFRRALLLWGEPGVGKSHIARHVTDRAGGKRLRIRARDLEHLRSLGSLVDFLQPSGVIIDDLDRAKEPKGIIEEFDEIKAKAMLFIVTVNWVKKLDPAILRRFDDDAHINKLDDEVLARMLEGVEPEIVTKLQGLPVDYISKYREAHQALGPELAAQELDRLISRYELVQEMMEESGAEAPSPPSEVKGSS